MTAPTTREELLEWGKREAALRVADIRQVKSAEGLRDAQSAARERRLAAGLRAGEAVHWVVQAQRGGSS